MLRRRPSLQQIQDRRKILLRAATHSLTLRMNVRCVPSGILARGRVPEAPAESLRSPVSFLAQKPRGQRFLDE